MAQGCTQGLRAEVGECHAACVDIINTLTWMHGDDMHGFIKDA